MEGRAKRNVRTANARRFIDMRGRTGRSILYALFELGQDLLDVAEERRLGEEILEVAVLVARLEEVSLLDVDLPEEEARTLDGFPCTAQHQQLADRLLRLGEFVLQ